MKLGLALILPLLLEAFIEPAAVAEESLSARGDGLFGDGYQILTAPLQWRQTQWQNAAGLAAITATLVATADQGVANYYNHHRLGRVTDVMQSAGDVLSPLALAGYSAALWGAGQWMQNDALSRSGFKMGEAVVYATAITDGIKILVGRARPSPGADANDFSGWSWRDDHQSFPSAHAAAAFAAARVLSPQLTPGQRMAAYAAAALVSYSRIYQGNHWLSDTVFGAGLGYAVGTVLADNNGNSNQGWRLMPAPSGASLSWLQTW